MSKTQDMTSMELIDVLDHIQSGIGRGNELRGFHQEGDELRRAVQYGPNAGSEKAHAPLRTYYMAKVALIMSEGAEALEELRSGRPVKRNYYTIEGQQLTNPNWDSAPDPIDGQYTSRVSEMRWSADQHVPKPEGVPSELADIVIRCFDFADEAGFSLGAAIHEKLDYNATRAMLHGRKI